MIINPEHKKYELRLLDKKKLREFFKEKVIAYGFGSYFNEVKDFLDENGLSFDDVIYTEKSNTKSLSGRDVDNLIENNNVLICSSFYEEIIKSIKNKPKAIKIASFSEKDINNSNEYKNYISRKLNKKHKKILANLKTKNKIRVVFIVIQKSIWKVETIFKLMQSDPFFEPIILVCPYVIYGEDRMWEELEETYVYFKEKGYPVVSSYCKKISDWIKIDELNPDLIFFSTPYKLTKKIYHEDAFLNYLTFYIPYFYLITSHDNDQPIYNQVSHNAMWKIFLPHKVAFRDAKEIAANKAKNAVVTGYPFGDILLSKPASNSLWKKQDRKKIKIIYAPHHTIDEQKELQLSTFLIYSELFRKLSIDLIDEIQWCFKPHPILRLKLYLHPDWGKEKTDEYYAYWGNSSNTQIEFGDYIDIFKESDCMIHDCGSFLVEYLFMKKPCLYLTTEKTFNFLNDFGIKAIECYEKASNEKEIEQFIKNITKNNSNKNIKTHFINKHINDFHVKNTPTEKIVEYIKKEIMQKPTK